MEVRWNYEDYILSKGSPSSLIGSESADESMDESESSQFKELLEYLHLSSEVSLEESKVSTALTFLFEHLGIGLQQAYLSETNELDNFPLNLMLGKVSRLQSQTVNHQNIGVGLVEISMVEGAQVTEVSAPTSPGTKSTKKSQEPVKDRHLLSNRRLYADAREHGALFAYSGLLACLVNVKPRAPQQSTD
ncbi:hypothetical protein Tco_0155762 [Tanacetum coccineum]